MERGNDRALLNLQRRLERQFFEGCRLDSATKNWVAHVYDAVADVVGDSVAVTAAFDVITALNTGECCSLWPRLPLMPSLASRSSRITAIM